ncbi:MAG TPA: hypothetical protein VKA74_00335, partial [Myxococcota bacterium]|nr:hypothetical protein [Myxococcota bacterium]
EERLAFYDRFLGPQGRSLDRSVRSRLSLDAALLERERGNAAGFSERLHQATRLDMSNKAAASLAAQHHASRSGDPVMIFERQLVLLNADPLDPHVHMTIARLLVAQGSHAASRRFLTNAVQLFKLETGRAPAEIEETRIAMDWQIDGPQEITESLGAVIRDRRTEARSRLESYRELQLPTDDLPRPEEIRFGLGIDKLRLLAAHSMDDREQTRSVLDDIEATVAQDLQTLGALAQRRGVDVNAVLTEVVNKVADLQVMRAIVGLEADQIRKDIDTIVENQPRLAPSFASIEPMALYAEGRYEEALEASEPFSDSAVIALIRGQILEKLDRREEAIETYSAVARARALDAYGAFALSRLKSLGAGDRVVTAAGRQMAQVAQTVPDWIDQM